MPINAALQKETEALDKSHSSSSAGGELTHAAESENAPDKPALMKRLLAQGAVKVFPTSGEESEGVESEVQEQAGPLSAAASSPSAAPSISPSATSTPMAKEESEDAESESVEAGTTDKAFHDRVQQQTDAANNPKWHNVSQRIDNARHGKWDLSQSRERSGARKQDVNLEEDVRTNKHMNQIAPGTFDVKQKAKNAINEVRQNPGQTLAGMIPVVGSGIKQAMAERSDVRERDLHRGIAATTESDEMRESSSSREKAVHTKIKGDRAKAVIGTITGGVGKVVPAYGQAASAAGTAINMAIDQGTKGSREQVNMNRAREMAQRDMGGKATHGFEGFDDYMATKKQAKDLSAVGQGKKGATAPSVDSPEQAARLTAYQRGGIQHQKQYEKRYKEVEKERAAAAKEAEAADKPKVEGAGIMSKFKNLFKRSS